MRRKFFGLIVLQIIICTVISAQPPKGIHWAADGNSFYEAADYGIVQVQLPALKPDIIIGNPQLTPAGAQQPLQVENFFFSNDGSKMLIFTNSKKVWRYHTRGDYWVYDKTSKSLKQLGKSLPPSSLMYAKLSPDGNSVAYVSMHNIYTEDIATGTIKQLTTDGTDRMINGTFDWVYEEEFDCRDGFRWSPDSKSIAYWKIDARQIPNFLLIDNTDSIYSFTKPVEYPKVGVSPSFCYIYVVNVASGTSTKMNVPGDAQQHYIPRMEWADNSTELVIQQLDRKQQQSKIMYCNTASGNVQEIYNESDKAWIDIKARWSEDPTGWEWVKGGNAFLWVSEKDGWRHVYMISRDGKKETLITKGNYDIITINGYDDKSGYIYFTASPQHATQKYLYRIKMSGGEPEKLSPSNEQGTHEYDVSPTGLYAAHNFSNADTPWITDWVSLPTHKVLRSEDAPAAKPNHNKIEFFQVTTEDNVTMDGWMIKPTNFDSTRKYPVVFYVYTEPATTTVNDQWGTARSIYNGNMADDGYIYISLDGRGTPSPKGAAWRKAIYGNVGVVNVHDQAMAAKKIMQWPYVDTSRIAVWGWSGGGSTTLNLIFQYGDIYKTGIAIAPVASQLTYDDIYEERYMGLPQENYDAYVKASPITYAKNLKGNLLVVHGTGDDNVHYQNTELLINELVKYNRQFSLMSYPNRTHSINEGEGTTQHLHTLFTTYLKEHCPPGAK
jgi:dipeptidyl-peptidase-4